MIATIKFRVIQPPPLSSQREGKRRIQRSAAVLTILVGLLLVTFTFAAPKLSEPFWVFGFPSDAGLAFEGIPVTLTARVFNPHSASLQIHSRPAGCLDAKTTKANVVIPPFGWSDVDFTFESTRATEGPVDHLATFLGTLGNEPVEVRIPFHFYAKKRYLK